jgi:hypothetical protein
MYCLSSRNNPVVCVSFPFVLLDARCKPLVREVPALHMNDYIERLAILRLKVRFPIEKLSEDIIKAGEWVVFGA